MKQIKSYTALRKQREEFRKKLVNLILKSEDEWSLNDIPSEGEKDVLRYYYYIHHGIDTVHVSPLDDKWLKHIYSLIPKKLKHWTTILTDLTNEIKEEFILNVKKAIVDFVLQDPRESDNRIKEFQSVHRMELRQTCKGWGITNASARAKLLRNLHIVNPCMAQVLDLWHKSFK